MNFKRTAALVTSTAMAFALVGCGAAANQTNPGMNKFAGMYNAAAKRAKEKGGTWDVLIHLAGENNLYRFALEDLNEMEAGLPEDGTVNVYVLFDGIKNGDSCIYKIKKDKMNSEIVSEKIDAPSVIPASGEVDSGSVEVVDAFMNWAGKNTKGDHTMVAFWDHGSGLFHGGPNPITKGFGWDDNGTNLETGDLTRLMATWKASSGRNMDGVGFDACLMAHGEIAYQIKDSADYLVASEELEPGKGWDYTGWLKTAGGGQTTGAQFTSNLVDSYIASYAPGGSQSSGRDNVTLSSIDVKAFSQNVVPALNEFVTSASANLASNKPAFKTSRDKTQVFYNSDCADMGSFFTNLKGLVSKSDKALGASVDKVSAAYKTCIVREGHSKNYAGATGAVLYFPKGTQSVNSVYLDPSKIAFAATEWKTFLKTYR